MSGKPLTPREMREHASPIPEVVFNVFNALIAKGAGIRSVTVLEKTVVAHLVERGYTSAEIYEKCWLDVEPAYEAAGWRVTYDKPGYNESYDASWTFTPGEEAAKR